MRTETDSFGPMEVADDALYGAQTARALANFQLSDERLPDRFIQACLAIKAAASRANSELGVLEADVSNAIVAACHSAEQLDFKQQFPVDVYQTGSGTSTNMNVNEVLATLASRNSGVKVNPNDHVNASQSSNDTIPAAIQISAVLALESQLLPALTALNNCIEERGVAFADVIKTGRTHLMDAMPISVQQEFSAWCETLSTNQRRLQQCLTRLKALPQGGTAIGTGINAPDGFADRFCFHLNHQLQSDFCPHNNPFYGISMQDATLELSSILRAIAVALIKISNDLRWMNSGPLAGLAEIALPALQPGSSIMPGKVNPVIPEAVIMASYQVMGFDSAIALCAQSGNFQLNVTLPLIARNLLQGIELLSQACQHLDHKALRKLSIQQVNIERPLQLNPVLVTALNPIVGYQKAAEIAKAAYQEGRPILDVAGEMTDLSEQELIKLLDPKRLAHPES
ncbi:MAG: class II fumarate hydratase [Saccharospirillum sp.]|nr:class II fumarate hydratase [Saccharospirillum sp.]